MSDHSYSGKVKREEHERSLIIFGVATLIHLVRVHRSDDGVSIAESFDMAKKFYKESTKHVSIHE